MFSGHRDAVVNALENRGFYASRQVLGVGGAHPRPVLQRHHRLADNGPPMSYQRQRA